MIERVARAICKQEYGSEDAGWDNQIPAARAAISAMREPTPAMLAELKGLDPFFRGAGKLWTALIDLELSEPVDLSPFDDVDGV